MTDVVSLGVSTPASEVFVLPQLTPSQTSPGFVTQALSFNPGFGQDEIKIGFDTSPYIIRLGAGLRPEDVQLVMHDDVYQPSAGFTQVSWELRFKHSQDRILVTAPWAPPVWMGASAVRDSLLGLVQVEFADGTIWSGEQVLAALWQPANVRYTVYGTSGADLLTGDEAAHKLSAGLGQDTLVSGSGSELLEGGGGLNTYRFDRGNGQDTIRATADLGNDKGSVIELGAGLVAADVALRRDRDDLIIALSDGGSIRFESFDRSVQEDDFKIHQIVLADGTGWTQAQLMAAFVELGSSNAHLDLFGLSADGEVLLGGAGDDTLRAYGGQDTLLGGDGRDLLLASGASSLEAGVVDGGRGNDQIALGADVAEFGAAFGQDVITAKFANPGTLIRFKDGINRASLSFYQDGLDLVMLHGSTGDSLRLSSLYYQLGSDSPTSARVEFADGSSASLADVAFGRVAPVTDLTVSPIVQDLPGQRTLVFSATGGHRTLSLDTGTPQDQDTVRITGPVRQSDVMVKGEGEGVGVSFGNLGSMSVQGLPAELSATRLVFRFDDGSTLSLKDLVARSQQSLAGDQTLVSSPYGDRWVLGPGSGKDYIYGVRNNPTDPDRADRVVLGTTNVSFALVPLGGRNPNEVLTITVNDGLNDVLTLNSGDDIKTSLLSSTLPLVELPDGSTLTGVQVLDIIRTGGRMPPPVATGDQVLSGTFRDETFYGGLGQDLIEAGQGNDHIDLRGGGTDTLVAWAGDGTDTVLGDVDVLRLRGGIQRADLSFSGNHIQVTQGVQRTYTLLGTQTVGRIEFDDGSVMTAEDIRLAGQGGTPGDDAIVGTAGNDLLVGQAGHDTLSGLAGQDTLMGGRGSNTLLGGAGDDLLIATGQGDRLAGGAGHDTLDVSGATLVSIQDAQADLAGDTILLGVRRQDVQLRIDQVGRHALLMDPALQPDYLPAFSLDNFAADDGSLADVRFRFSDGQVMSAVEVYNEALKTSAASDMVIGTGGHELIDGGEGDDIVYAGGGQDTLRGGAGADELNGEAGQDQLFGGAGQDLLVGGDGHDTLSGDAGQDILLGWAGQDTYLYQRGDGYDHIEDHAQGTESGDTIQLGAGITAGDLVVMAIPQDPALGGAYHQLDVVLKDGSGGFTVRGEGGSYDALARVKLADGTVLSGGALYARRVGNVGTSGRDNLWATASAMGPDVSSLSGGLGNDTLNGNVSRDSLDGGAGNDSLLGRLGDDTLLGGAGNDTLSGGAGNDVLQGGKGNDTYLFARGEGVDTVTDTDASWLNADLLKVSGASSSQLWFSKVGNSLDISIIGTSDKVRVQDWFVGTSNRIEKITAGDGKSLSAAKVQGLVNAMASFALPADGVTTLPANTPAALTKVVASSWV